MPLFKGQILLAALQWNLYVERMKNMHYIFDTKPIWMQQKFLDSKFLLIYMFVVVVMQWWCSKMIQ